MSILKTIEFVTTDGEAHAISIEDARLLYNELHELFGGKQTYPELHGLPIPRFDPTFQVGGDPLADNKTVKGSTIHPRPNRVHDNRGPG
jgi:hypothetical protein